ncbi:Aspartokinase [Pseudoalteromonas luteoviolacea B = ATCC 29581]|nr:Aspartokinase [Pseudoalteromonas luteoviolacea B = ATCC 29581]
MTQAVHKFGGSSLSSASRYQAVANIVLSQCVAGDCVVVSAAGKTTNTLVKLWQSHVQADTQAVADILLQLGSQQTQLIQELLVPDAARSALATLDDELRAIAEQSANGTLHEASLLAHGELWSARLLGVYLNQLGVAAQSLDARQLFTLHQGQLLEQRNQQVCLEKVSRAHINVMTGFIASDSDGQTVTLGRNGSDYSATLLANYISAKSVSIWTDTQGVYSTDPRKVASAIKYPKVCRAQANLLARLGNPVLHAKTLSPLKNTDIKLVVRSSYEPEATPTEVVKEGFSKEKRFITTLENQDLVKVEQLQPGEVRELSQRIQHSIHHYEHGGDVFLIVPAAFTHQVVQHLQGRANLIGSNLNGCAIVAPSNEIKPLQNQARILLDEQEIVVRFEHAQSDYALFLTDQLIDSDALATLHDKLVKKGQELAVIIAGLGNVGEVFVAQCKEQLNHLQRQFDVKVVGLLRSDKMLFAASGVNLEHWTTQWHNQAVSYTDADLLARIAELDYEHKVVIDITASERFSKLYPDFVHADCHLISANKYAGTAELEWYRALRASLKERNLHWRYNTSVGAGLPINFALADLQNSGDHVVEVEGVFSGTLSWLCSRYDGTTQFSDLVLEAQQLGYTEPDPREDLSGRDMQRKLLILARDLGLALNLEDIELNPLMPDILADGDWNTFLANRQLLDEFIAEQANLAEQQNKVLRYTGALRIEGQNVSAKVGIALVEDKSALANLTAGDNIFVIRSQWYQTNPLVIQGPGAGKEVTAAGIHSDLYWLIQQLR